MKELVLGFESYVVGRTFEFMGKSKNKNMPTNC